MAILTRPTLFKSNALTCALLLTLVTTPVMADEASAKVTPVLDRQTLAEQQKRNENIGFGTGMVVGAIAAGPIGAIVSSVIGVLTANHINVVDEKEQLAVQLDNQQNEYQAALSRYQRQLQLAEQSYQDELLSLQQKQQLASQLQAENLLMSLQFSTGSSEIKQHYLPQISSLAKLLQQSPNVNVDLSGYTDLQGSDELNHALSIARVNSVKKALIEQGIEPERISLYAFGEQAPVVANNERQVSFYDRRVVIKLQPNGMDQPNQHTVSNN
ncbi:hypothetical protein tinsulaeT_00830 [Thalassotalea insulae]|uniref:OmpA-like domain-containing protein n=1 Tax=Thalassotalea insulae TaxID=2056778 RepID=A0ABQ6GL45_9GAMM|nr:sortase-associated OmpA-like protein PdsO [Thalassotalea insulae]GLX76743.1 hypothetical protein tinsulaeT_00830 [Thalassotalea insulae]